MTSKAQLFEAAAADDADLCTRLLLQGQSANATQDGSTLLHVAAENNSIAVAKVLLGKNADVDGTDGTSQTALHRTAVNGCAEIATLLLEKGANANAVDSTGSTPLHLAVQQQNVELVGVLLDHKADVNVATPIDTATDNGGVTALHFAVFDGSADISELLIRRGASLQAKDAIGETALHKAARGGFEEVASLLAASGASLDDTSRDGYRPADLAQDNKVKAVLDGSMVGGKSGGAAGADGKTRSQGCCIIL